MNEDDKTYLSKQRHAGEQYGHITLLKAEKIF